MSYPKALARRHHEKGSRHPSARERLEKVTAKELAKRLMTQRPKTEVLVDVDINGTRKTLTVGVDTAVGPDELVIGPAEVRSRRRR